MTVSVRAYLLAGAAAATATTIALTSVQVTPPDIAVPAQPTAPQPELSEAMIDLLAAARRMTVVIPAPVAEPGIHAPHGGAAPGFAQPRVHTAPSAQATAPGGVVVQNAASDFIISAWDAAVPWIDYGVGLVDGALGWVPGLAIIGDQVSLLWTYLGYPVANSFVRDLVAPVVNSPLNLDTWANGFSAVASTTVNSLANTGVAEFNYFFGWLIPPVALTAPTESVTFDAAVAADVLNQARAAVTGFVDHFAAMQAPTQVAPQEQETTPETTPEEQQTASDLASDQTADQTGADTAETVDNTDVAQDVEETEKATTQPVGTETSTGTRSAATPARAVAKNIRRDLQRATAGLRGVVKDIRTGLGLVKPKKPTGKTTRPTQPTKAEPSKAEPSKTEPSKAGSDSSSGDSDD
ncbi:hypothetical protein [Mycolicibacterium goodii]|uniref:PE family protein n=1 Tax=Mycolicibacterium goodii TaxID=134601 RepID=A0A0K0X6F6_MYCGD|nr:hypothetical protein AFA91_14905 [Mycolicibacterium goodii]